MLNHILNKTLLLLSKNSCNSIIREASKKAGGSARNRRKHGTPKRYGIKVVDGELVQAGSMVVKQRTLNYHPGLNVGLGKNGNLFAMEQGRIVITAEKADLNWDHTWVQRTYAGRQDQEIYKKYINIIATPQKDEFVLIDQI